MAFYLRSASVIHFEMQIRPEGVFPFFAAAQLCLLLAFARAWWGEVRRPDRAAVYAGTNLLAAALLYQLKPSYGLAVGVAALPVAWAVVFPVAATGLAAPAAIWWARRAAAILAAGVLFVLPEHELARADPNTRLFLPETLLTVHATVIREQMLADRRGNFHPPFAPEWFAIAANEFDREVDRAARPDARPYPSLGINPDYLLYEDSFCRWLFLINTRQQIVDFCFYYYERAWTHHPGAMLANVGRQLGVFYTWHSPAFLAAQKLKIERFYNKTNAAFSFPAYHAQMLTYPPAAAYLDQRRRAI